MLKKAFDIVCLLDDKIIFESYKEENLIEELISYKEKIYIDSLTDCYNRRYFDEKLMDLKGVTAVAILDVDEFKYVNDYFGHAIGDVALKLVARILLDNIGTKDKVIRMGGDEFIIIFHKIPEDILYLRLDELRMQFERMPILNHPEVHITVSIGGCCCKKYNDEILKSADNMLYAAKKTRNMVVVKEKPIV